MLKKMNISAKIMFLIGTVGLLFALSVGTVVTLKVGSTLTDTAMEKSKSDVVLSLAALDKQFPGDWKVIGDELFKGSTKVNNNVEMIEYITKTTKGTATVFLGDTRIATNMMKNNKRMIGTKASKQVIDKTLKKGENFSGKIKIGNQLYMASYEPIKNQYGEIIGMWYIGTPDQQRVDTVTEIVVALLIAMGVLLVVSFAIVWLFAHSIKKRLKNLSLVMKKAGRGDFTTELAVKGSDEIALVSKGYEQMRLSLGKLINGMMNTSEQLAASAEQLHASSDETSKAADSIALNVEEVATSSEAQTDIAEKLEKIMGKMVDDINQIDSSIQTVSVFSNEQEAAAQTGEEVIARTKQQVELINLNNLEASQNINYLEDKSNAIGSIINIISEIAEQTNLLALNAAIEAARAGEHGRGFAVVAEEVRKLAEQSNQSANQIRGLILEIQEGIHNSVTSMESGRTAIDKGLQLANNAEKAFININQSIVNLREQTVTVNESLNKLNESTYNVNEVVDITIKMIQETSQATQSVAAATEEQNASMEEINASAQALSDLSEEMRESLATFKI